MMKMRYEKIDDGIVAPTALERNDRATSKGVGRDTARGWYPEEERSQGADMR